MPHNFIFESFYRSFDKIQVSIFPNKPKIFIYYFSFNSSSILHNFLISTFLNQVKVGKKSFLSKIENPEPAFLCLVLYQEF